MGTSGGGIDAQLVTITRLIRETQMTAAGECSLRSLCINVYNIIIVSRGSRKRHAVYTTTVIEGNDMAQVLLAIDYQVAAHFPILTRLLRFCVSPFITLFTYKIRSVVHLFSPFSLFFESKPILDLPDNLNYKRISIICWQYPPSGKNSL